MAISIFGRFKNHVQNVTYNSSYNSTYNSSPPVNTSLPLITSMRDSWSSCAPGLLTVEDWENGYVSAEQLELAEDRIQELEMIIEMMEDQNGE